jgi:hypothetical protein
MPELQGGISGKGNGINGVNNQIEIKIAQDPGDFLLARELILEYTKWLDFDLAFQHIDEEMAGLPEMYGNRRWRTYTRLFKRQSRRCCGDKKICRPGMRIKAHVCKA